MYKHKIEGTAIVGTKLKSIEPYEAEFTINEGHVGLARSYILRNLLPVYLRKRMDNFRSVREIEVVDTTEVDGNPSDEDSSEVEELYKQALELSCVPETLQSYGYDKQKIKILKTAITRRKNKLKKDAEKNGTSQVEDKGYID